MGQMDGLTKASAVHLRIEDDEKKSKQCKEYLNTERGKGHCLPPDTCNKCNAYDGFQ